MRGLVYSLTTDPLDTRVAIVYGPSDDAALVDIADRDVPPGRTWRLVDLPPDRTFRNAWKRNGAMIDVDMPKARQIHMDRIRRERNARLDELDKDWMKAVGQGDTTRAATVEAQRQVLRDLPQTFDLSTATTPEDLKARWPSQLPQP